MSGTLAASASTNDPPTDYGVYHRRVPREARFHERLLDVVADTALLGLVEIPAGKAARQEVSDTPRHDRDRPFRHLVLHVRSALPSISSSYRRVSPSAQNATEDPGKRILSLNG